MNEADYSDTGVVAGSLLLGNNVKVAFVGRVDEVTFGVADGLPFHTADRNWPAIDQIQWARANAAFHSHIAAKLTVYARCVEDQSANVPKSLTVPEPQEERQQQK